MSCPLHSSRPLWTSNLIADLIFFKKLFPALSASLILDALGQVEQNV